MSTAPHPPVIRIESGDIRGLRRDGSTAFLGIPYAAAPVGDLRFAAPAPVEPWSEVRDATAFGPTPKRVDDGGPTLIPEPSIPGDSILNLDVFAPDPAPDASLPVLVWIHGGGFTGGSPASPWYDGAAFTRDGVVTVAISYRLGFDGFGILPDAPANRGVLDWLAALGWVQRNIAAFGGDPARVTIGGQSAGGYAVLRLLALERAQPLFSSVWCSSAAMADLPLERAKNLTTSFAQHLGVSADVAGFSSVDPVALERAQAEFLAGASGKGIEAMRILLEQPVSFAPVLDGELLIEPVVEALGHGIGADKRLVLGSNDDEVTPGIMAIPTPFPEVPPAQMLGQVGLSAETCERYVAANPDLPGHGVKQLLGHYLGDAVFRRNVPAVAHAREAAGGGTWAYRFTWPSARSGFATHCLDVPFLFDCLAEEHVAGLAGEHAPQRLADDLHGSAVSFITSENPGWSSWRDPERDARIFDGAESPAPTLAGDGYAGVEPLVGA